MIASSYYILINKQLLSLSTIVLCLIVMIGKEIFGFYKNVSENNLTIKFPSNTGHKSIGMKLLALTSLYIHSNSLNVL